MPWCQMRALVACASLWSLASSCVHYKAKHRASPGFPNHILNRISYFMGSVWIWLSVFKRTCHPENHMCTEPALGKTEDVKFFSSFIFFHPILSLNTFFFPHFIPSRAPRSYLIPWLIKSSKFTYFLCFQEIFYIGHQTMLYRCNQRELRCIR